MKIALLVTAIIAATMSFAFRESIAGTTLVWLVLAVPHALLAAWGVYRFHRDGTLGDMLRPRSGDISIGALVAAVLFGAGWIVRQGFFADGTERWFWLLRLSHQFGAVRPSPTLLLTIAVIAALEELVWRGLVQSALAESVGTRRAWPLAALGYALVHVPTVFLLAAPPAGANPILLLAAAGCGLVWSFLASLTGRLPAVIVSHAVFSYFAFAMLVPHL
jgi:membrane protease YdiL (CAAX protease family)